MTKPDAKKKGLFNNQKPINDSKILFELHSI